MLQTTVGYLLIDVLVHRQSHNRHSVLDMTRYGIMESTVLMMFTNTGSLIALIFFDLC
ncbi:hypothetical protein [Haliscomenobacter sp.]|uniref:hypothetical protein n=1 Tax=Haliscomenobacter sp. TaxID=2717303 RepID=UPI003BAA8043